MRIVSGKFKGRHIPVQKNFSARPTTDFAKESLFNILNNYFDFEHIEVLDLFSGTGSISLEFASRGTTQITAIEKDARTCDFIKQTCRNLELSAVRVLKADVFTFIKKCRTSFDIVFADPPYQLENIAEIPKLILESNLLKPDGWLVFEHGRNNSFETIKGFRESRNYGGVHFSIFSNAGK